MKLRNYKYVLTSILVHDGVAGSGHYYSFIRNHDGSWQRYNDIQVTDEKEEQVFKEAIGGLNHISAYCLVYTSQASIDEEMGQIKAYMRNNALNQGNEIEVPKQHYNMLLSHKFKEEVDQDNRKFHEEIKEYRFQTFMKNVTENYQTRLDTINSIYNTVARGPMPYYINSFGLFLKHEAKSDYLLKWYILDTCLQDTDPNNKFKLRELKNQPKLLKILQNSLASLGNIYSLRELVLQTDDDQRLDTNLAEYVHQLPAAIVCLFVLEKSMEEQWVDTLCAIRRFAKMVRSSLYYLDRSHVFRASTRLLLSTKLLRTWLM